MVLAAIIAILLVGLKRGKSRDMSREAGARGEKGRANKKGKGNVDEVFFNRIKVLIKYAIPSWTCKEAQLMFFLGILLIIRTFMSIWIADVNGRVVKSIVNKSLTEFLQRIFTLFLFAVPSSTVNSGLDYCQKKLALCFRRRITNHFHELYLNKMHYYKICNLDNRIDNPD